MTLFSDAMLLARRTLLVLAAGSLLALAGCSEDRPKFNAIDITGAEYARDFQLTDHNGQPRSLKDFKGKVVVLFFGYTQCPDVCPTSMVELAEVKKLLGPQGDKLQGLFVTLDAMYVEGLVHITELGGEYFRFDEARQELRGERTGMRYAIGSRVRVQVSRVDLDGRRIDFRLVNEGEDLPARPGKDRGLASIARGDKEQLPGKFAGIRAEKLSKGPGARTAKGPVGGRKAAAKKDSGAKAARKPRR